MKDYGLVSVITPAYNSERFIGEMIQSVLNQSYHNWELVITDDCSTDNTAEIVRQYSKQDDRIHYYCLKENSGAGVARNNSIEKAKGRFITFLDADDMWMPQKLEIQLDFMIKKDCAMSFASHMLINESSEIIGIEVAPNKHTLSQCKKDNKAGFLTTVYDIDKVGKVMMPTLRKRQDWGLVLKVLLKCKEAYGIKMPIAYYRIGQESISKNKWSLVKYNIALYQTVLGWTKIYSILYFLFVYIPNWTFKIWLKAQYNK